MKRKPNIQLIPTGRFRESFNAFVQEVITDTFVFTFNPTEISFREDNNRLFILKLGPVDNSSPSDGDYTDYGDIKGYKFSYDDLMVSDAINYLDVYLYGIKQEKDRFSVELYDYDGNKLTNNQLAKDCVEIRIIFNTDITRRPYDVIASDFEIIGKIVQIE